MKENLTPKSSLVGESTKDIKTVKNEKLTPKEILSIVASSVKTKNGLEKADNKTCVVKTIQIALHFCKKYGCDFDACKKVNENELPFYECKFFDGSNWQNVHDFIVKDFLVSVAINAGVSEVNAGYHLFINELFEQLIITTCGNIIKEDVKQ